MLPVGATEQHGPHLATGTDFVLAGAAAVAACERSGDIVLPRCRWAARSGTPATGRGRFRSRRRRRPAVVLETGRWVRDSGFERLVLVNAHATNGPPCESALLQLRHECPDLLALFVSLHQLTPEITARYLCDAEDIHANEAETSLVMHVRPDTVRPERAVDEVDRTIGRVFPYAMPAVSRSGVVGRLPEPRRRAARSSRSRRRRACRPAPAGPRGAHRFLARRGGFRYSCSYSIQIRTNSTNERRNPYSRAQRAEHRHRHRGWLGRGGPRPAQRGRREYLFGAYVDMHGVPKSKCVPVGHLEDMAAGSELYTVGALEGMGALGPNEDECVGGPRPRRAHRAALGSPVRGRTGEPLAARPAVHP